MEYGHWVEEQDRQISELRNALHSDIGDMELRIFVDGGMRHYYDLFTMKATAAKADVLYVMSGLWRTSAERFFFWIGGFRPSELLKVLLPDFEPLTDQQRFDVCNLTQSCQQAEDTLSQGMENLHRILGQAIAKQLGEGRPYPARNSPADFTDPDHPPGSSRPPRIGGVFATPSGIELALVIPTARTIPATTVS